MYAAEGALPDHGVEGVQAVAPGLGGVVALPLRRARGVPAVGTPGITDEVSGDISRVERSRAAGGVVSVAPLAREG